MTSIQFFTRKVFFFVIIPIVFFIIFLGTIIYLNNKLFNNYILPNNVDAVFIGDSHIEMSANDLIIKNSINLSQNSEAYVYSFFKLKEILKLNPSIKRVFLGFSYHNLSTSYDDVVVGIGSKDVSPRYFFILPRSKQLEFLKFNSSELTPFAKNIAFLGLKNLIAKNKKYSFLGYYTNTFQSSRAIKSSMDKRIRAQYYDKGKLYGFSDYNIHYLQEIIHLCENKKVDLVVLNTPLQSYYKNKVPNKYVQKYNDVISSNHLKVESFKDLVLTDSCFIPDGDHVSERGAVIVSRYLNKVLGHKIRM